MASLPTSAKNGSKPRRDPPDLRPMALRLLAATLVAVGPLKAAEPEVADPTGPESDEAQAALPRDSSALWEHVERKRQFTEQGTPAETSRTTLRLEVFELAAVGGQHRQAAWHWPPTPGTRATVIPAHMGPTEVDPVHAETRSARRKP
jgi:hypothetical protein